MQDGQRLGKRRFALHRVLLHLQAGAAPGQRAAPGSHCFDASAHLTGVRVGELSHGVAADKLRRIARRG